MRPLGDLTREPRVRLLCFSATLASQAGHLGLTCAAGHVWVHLLYCVHACICCFVVDCCFYMRGRACTPRSGLHGMGWHYLSNAACLMQASSVLCVVYGVNDRPSFATSFAALEQTCVRQVVSDEWFPPMAANCRPSRLIPLAQSRRAAHSERLRPGWPGTI